MAVYVLALMIKRHKKKNPENLRPVKITSYMVVDNILTMKSYVKLCSIMAVILDVNLDSNSIVVSEIL